MGQIQARHPLPPAALSQRRSRFLRGLGRAYLRLGGWRFEGAFPVEHKYVMIVAPHTSNWDFLVSVAALLALDVRVSWLGKRQLFSAPFEGLLRALGGIPVDRDAAHGVVDQCVQAFDAAPALMLALAPEGTRKGPSRWKSGFYRIAASAGVPIFPVGLDYREHVVRFMPVFRPTGDYDADIQRIQALFEGVRGLKPRGSD
jgi:1-acyl-sn-glycerol-3-phosphate acyltransferase